MNQPEDKRDPQDKPRMWPDPSQVRDSREFREALTRLRESRGLTLENVAKASHDGSRKLSPSGISGTLNADALPRRDFTARFLRGCGLSEEDQQPWLRRWEELNWGLTARPEQSALNDEGPVDQRRPAEPPRGPLRRVPRLPRGRGKHAAVASCVLIALVAGAGVWQLYERDTHEQQQADDSKPSKAYCGTPDPNLRKQKNGECTGVTDGANPAVFGKNLTPVMTAIREENKEVVKGGNYVTVAFMAPLTSKSNKALTIGQYVAELEGAYTAVETENDKSNRPKIRLVVGNMGSSERWWKHTVDVLTKMKENKRDSLVGVAGLGLSQQETVDATRALAQADLPMVGDLITADKFNSSDNIDGKGPIKGLARVALSNSDQLAAVGKKLGNHSRTAALVHTNVTPNGSTDLYTDSLNHGFRTVKGLKEHLDPTAVDFSFDPRVGTSTSLKTFSNNLCNTGKVVDTVYYAGRVKYLSDLLDELAGRSCHTQHITVVTAADAAVLDPELSALDKPDSPITLLYGGYPSADELKSSDNPDRGLYNDFAKAFTSDHHGQQFPPEHLTEGYWALTAHDAVLAVATAVHKANGDPDSGPPNRFAVRDQIFGLGKDTVTGATGYFGIDKHGNRTSTTSPATVHTLGKPLPSE